MPVDDQKVLAFIHSSWNANSGEPDKAKRAVLAWQSLYDLRNDPTKPTSAGDVDLAAAEHYRLTFFWVGTGKYSVTQATKLAEAYDFAKRVGLGKFMQNNSSRPVVAPDPAILKWAMRGVAEGEALRVSLGIPAPPTYRPIDESVNGTGEKLLPWINKGLGLAQDAHTANVKAEQLMERAQKAAAEAQQKASDLAQKTGYKTGP